MPALTGEYGGEEKMQEISPHPTPDLQTLQQWTESIGRAQQLMLEFWTDQSRESAVSPSGTDLFSGWADMARFWTDEGQKIAERQAHFLTQGLELWNRLLVSGKSAAPTPITAADTDRRFIRSEEHTSELQSLMRISYAVFF